MSQPSTFSSLELGYVYTPQGQCLPVEEVDLPLWQHGESGADPKDFGFRFKAGGEWHEVQVIISFVAVVVYVFIGNVFVVVFDVDVVFNGIIFIRIAVSHVVDGLVDMVVVDVVF